MANAPFTLVDDAVLAALTSYAPLTALVSATRITMADRAMDVRDPKLADIFKSIRIEPDGWRTANGVFRYTGSDTKQVLRYRVIIETAGLDLATCRAIEYEVFRAFTSMFETRSLLIDPAPWLYENKWDLGPATQEPYPADAPDRWVTRIDVGVALTVSIADLLTSLKVVPIEAQFTSDGTSSLVVIRFSSPLTDSSLDITEWSAQVNDNYPLPLYLSSTSACVWKGSYVVLQYAVDLLTALTLMEYSGNHLLDYTGLAVPGFTGFNATNMDP